MLTDNLKFPALQIHGEMMNIGCHDNKDSKFSLYILENFKEYIKSALEFDDNINYTNNKYITYGIYFNGNYEALYRFIKYIKNYNIKMVSSYRDPIERSISAFLHWLDKDALDRHLMVILNKTTATKEEIKLINHYPYELILSEENLTIEKCLDIYYKIFDDTLLYEYLCCIFNLKVHFGINLYLKKDENYIYRNSAGCQLFYFRLDIINNIVDQIYEFFEIPSIYKLSKERDYKKRINYIVDASEVKKYILENVKNNKEFVDNNLTLI
jgi:hypothetical protein